MPRLHRSLPTTAVALFVVMAITGCSSPDAVAPASGPAAGSAHIIIAGMLTTTQHDSIDESNVVARTWRQPPIPTSPTASQGAAELLLTWHGTLGLAPEPRSFGMPLPYSFSKLPQTITIPTASNDVWLGMDRVNGGPVGYTSSGGSVTITAFTDSSIAGTVKIWFSRGPVGANVKMTGTFNATLCSIQIDDMSNPCQPKI